MTDRREIDWAGAAALGLMVFVFLPVGVVLGTADRVLGRLGRGA